MNKHQNGFSLIIIILIALIVISGGIILAWKYKKINLASYFQPKTTPPITIISSDFTSPLAPLEKPIKNSTEESLNLEKKNSSICDEIEGQKDTCLSNVAKAEDAKANKDPLACENLLPQAIKDWCYWGVASAKQDLPLCEEIQDQKIKDNCYWGIAEGKNDYAICDKIQDKIIKNGCYESAKK